MTDTKESWSQFLTCAKEKCSKTAYDNWLAPISIIEASEEQLVLEVPNIFVQEYLLSNYRKELIAYLPLTAKGDPAIKFQIAPPKKTNKPIIKPTDPIQRQTHSSLYDIKLNERYSFESFIEGTSNQFIKSAAIGVASRPGKTYNPLLVHGGVGTGKTHLLHAIGNSIVKSHKKLRVQVITTEGFINALVDSLRKKSVDKMKQFYRLDVDVLLIDDIQFLQNRLNFEEEFCTLLEHYVQNGKQIVLTSDKPPSELRLSERMKARMEWGLVAHMGIPELETRVAILQAKADARGISLADDIAFFMAEHIYSNVRQLEGAVNRLSAHARLLDSPITREMIEVTLADVLQNSTKEKITVEQILKSVATTFQVRVSDIKGNSRNKEIALPRQVAMYLAKEMVNDSLISLGVFFNKTHSTILHAAKSIEKKMFEDNTLKRLIDMARQNLR